jgi:2,4-dienoyl-CoA reductase-like NADH-dependent reductase (Old Yellow Enzyme family)
VLASPFRLGALEVRNRVVFGPHVTLYCSHEGRPTEREGAYLAERAEGGVGMIVTGSQHVHPSGGGPRTVAAYDPDAMSGWVPIVDRCHRAGARMVAQLSHHGPEAVSGFTGRPLLAASAVPNPVVGEIPATITRDQIAEVVAGFATSAGHAVEAGFDGIELKVGHDGLLRTFLSPRTNRRDDDYGGDPAGRVRIVLEVLGAVRHAVGPEVPVGIRLCLDERLPGGYGADDAIAAAVTMAGAGAAWIHTDLGTWASMEHQIPPMTVPHGHAAELAARLRSAVDPPVIASGRIHTPELAEELLSSGGADLVSLARPLIADPGWAAKALSGATDRIRPCVACNQLCLGNLVRELPISCVHNPAAGREGELGRATVVLADRPRRVVVVGGGPGGLKAAEAAARLGHRVTLFEAAARTGGQVRIAAGAPDHHEWAGIVDHLERELGHLGVDMRTSTRADADVVMAERPEVVVVATGSRPAPPPFPVAGATLVDQWRAVPDPPCDRTVLVHDTGRRFEGAAVVETLAAAGNRVCWVTPTPWAGFEVDPATAAPLRRRLAALGVDVRAQRTVLEVRADGVTLLDVVTGAVEPAPPVEVVVTAGNKAASDELVTELRGRAPAVVAIGDAVAPRDVATAILEAERAVRALPDLLDRERASPRHDLLSS